MTRRRSQIRWEKYPPAATLRLPSLPSFITSNADPRRSIHEGLIAAAAGKAVMESSCLSPLMEVLGALQRPRDVPEDEH